jgi:hypothetical protein
MYTVTLIELKAVLKLSTQAGQSGVVNKTSAELTAQDDNFREIKKSKRHISNDASQSAKKSTKPVPTTAAVKLRPKAVSTHNFFAPLRITDMDTETAGGRRSQKIR